MQDATSITSTREHSGGRIMFVAIAQHGLIGVVRSFIPMEVHMRTLKHTRFNLVILALLVLVVFLALPGCSKGGADGATGATGAAGPSGVEIYSIVANPSVLEPGTSTDLNVSAGDGMNSALTYSWQADGGSLNSAGTRTATWTAPANVGSYLVSVEVTNAAGLTSRGYASILVSVSPAGPIITSVNPTEAKVGDQVRITGAGFGGTQGTSSISIGGTPASSIISWSDTVINATVPAGATTGAVVITEAGVNSSPGYIVLLWAKENTNNNVAICTAAFEQSGPQIISDGSGGAIIAWSDSRSGTNYDIYAQRVNSVGVTQWTTDGVAISTAVNDQGSPQIVSDGSGGAIITWNDYRSGTNRDIYAQRVSSVGAAQWTTNGVAISRAANNQSNPHLISDGSGGAIITWSDYRSGTNYDIYAQRVNSAGAVQWTADGVAISTAVDYAATPQLISDGSGGAIITWNDYRSGTNLDIYAQRVNSAGAVQWTADGVAISTAALAQADPQLTSDGSGGAIITWNDDRSGANLDIYAQRVSSAGAVQWTADGVAISTAANNKRSPQLLSDGSGGAIITWSDLRSVTNYNIYAQRVNSAGAVQWTADGVAISSTAKDQDIPQLISDGSGGAIIAWIDGQSGVNADIYAQRVNSAGAVQWIANGVAVSTAEIDQENPQLISDGSGGAIVTWMGLRGDVYYHIYAQGISASGRQ
jgi:hypothetical protein